MNKNNQPLVSIIMNCYNGEKYLREAIDSVYAQSYNNWEIIFWDNLSTDSSAKIAKSYDSKLRYFVGQETIPLGAARNKALEKCDGEYIAFLDADDIWMSEKLEKQIPLFNRDSKTAIVASNAIQFIEKGSSALFCKKRPKTGHVFRELLTNYFICLSTAVIRKRSLDDLNEWFDPRFSHIEESDLFIRISYTWHLDYVDEPLAKYRFHKESESYLNPERSPIETQWMLLKFMELYPNFDKLYYKEFIELKYYPQYHFALIDWKQGNNHLVRERLKPFLLLKFRAIIPFMLSFSPYSLYEFIYTLFNKYVRRIPSY